MKSNRQTTLRSLVSVSGVGVHSGEAATVTLGPSEANTGYVFIRSGLKGPDREFRAIPSCVTATELATVLGDASGPLVSTAEHVLAALRGLGVDNATIEVDGPEIPILDGSAAGFVEAIDRAGIVELAAARRFIEVLKPVQVALGDAFGELRPHSGGFRAEVEIFFDNAQIGHQAYSFDLRPESFRKDIARARTFGCVGDVERLWSAGFARGASLENALVFDETRVLNPEGLRFADECVRHKVLDIVGDLALAGLPLLGSYRSQRGGHKLNNAVLNAMMADRSSWRIVEAEERVRRLGGVSAMVAPAYGPDVS